jgi:hypothetical protein
MKPMIWLGILLIVLGALVLAYQGINYTREKKVLDVEPVHVTSETHERIPLSLAIISSAPKNRAFPVANRSMRNAESSNDT